MSLIKMTPLASGSKGNATLLSWGENNHALIDCGIRIKPMEEALKKQGIEASDLDAIIVTHEHGDHISGVSPFSRKHGTPIFMSRGTSKKADHKGVVITTFNIHESFAICGLQVNPFPVPHDARETCAFTFNLENMPEKRIGYLTDCGHITPHVKEMLSGISVLALEANHCPDMLHGGPYPQSLKARVGGMYGHLSNQQTASLLRYLKEDLVEVRLMHISENNNSPERALEICKEALHPHTNIIAARQDAAVDALILK
jgi:phosphoribosyl 1,2-cyclic phosphodiesterase